jgi:HEPN domain-containing protein
MNIEQPILAQVRKWIDFAEEDLRLARYSLTLESNCPYRLTAYHARQCAEKYLKAFLVMHKIDFPYTHSIIRLLEICSDIKEFPELKVAEELTPYAITSRYPGEDELVVKEEATHAIRLAELVKEIIKKELPNYK